RRYRPPSPTRRSSDLEESLRAIRNGLIGIGVHLDDQSICAGCKRRTRHGWYLIAKPSAVARVCHDRQVRQLVHERYCREVEHVANRRIEAANTAFTQYHVRVPLGENVLGAEQELLNRCSHSALQQYRLVKPANCFKQ